MAETYEQVERERNQLRQRMAILRPKLEAIDLLMPDVLAILPLLKGLAMFGEFDGLQFDGRTVESAMASAVATLTELEEIVAPQVYRMAEEATGDNT